VVEPQGQGRQEQALMLGGEDPALCHPGCVYPISSLEAPSLTLFYLLPSPTPHGTGHSSLVWG
jgi:hypothetical protein